MVEVTFEILFLIGLIVVEAIYIIWKSFKK